MTHQVLSEQASGNEIFWKNATKYAASLNNDNSFVSELAYVMVTLHRTGN